MVPTNVRIHRHPRVVHRELSEGEGAVLLNLESGAYYGLNEVGAIVWTLLDGTRTLDEVLEELRKRVVDAPASFVVDVQAFVADLARCGLVRMQE
ncbi:MAG: PqqD family protein [Armatimonadota bacterium]|nr:PqqD family protein [Armatimonadota bacterium]